MTWKLCGSLAAALLLATVPGIVAPPPATATGSAAAPAASNAAASARLAGTIEGTLTVRSRPPRRTASRYGGRTAVRPVQPVPPVVYLEGRIGDPPASDPQVAMAQRDTAFAPALLVVPVGTVVDFPNRDPFFHNVFSYSSAGRFDLGRYPQGESKEVRFEEPGIVKVYCEVHESMRAAVVVVENRYWAEPGPDGAFRLTDVPAGTYTLVAWQADRGETKREVRVADGGVTRVELEL